MRRNYKKKEEEKDFKKSKSRSKNRKDTRDARGEADLSAAGRDNDPNWYFTSKELAEQAAQLSFQNVLGYGSADGYVVPSIMKIETVMNPGVTYNVLANTTSPIINIGTTGVVAGSHIDSGKAGVNLMSAKLYSLLAATSGRVSNYAPQDVAMMILAISSTAETVEYIRRAFGLALTYNPRNRTMPINIIRSMGFDADDLIAQLSVYRMRFNVALARINQIPLLDNIAFIKKSREVYQRVFMDDPTDMSQIFYYAPKYYFILDEEGDDNGSILRAHEWTDGRLMAEALDYLNKQITALLESTSLNLIYADLRNMANKFKVPVWSFDYCAENYIVMPEYNQNALLQLHNLTIVGTPGADDGSDFDDTKHLVTGAANVDFYVTGGASIFCDANKNDIVYNPVFLQAYQVGHWFVDMPSDKPTVEDKIEALRYTAVSSGAILDNQQAGYDDTTNCATLMALPDHYVAKVTVYGNFKSNGAPDGTSVFNNSVIRRDLVINTGNAHNVTNLSQFENAPILVLPDPMISGTSWSGTPFWNVFGGLQYFTTVDYAYIKRLLEVMTIGLFDFRA